MREDAELIRACLACRDGRGGSGDGWDEFRELADRHAEGLRRLLMGRLRDPWRVDEAVQETVVRAYEGLSGLRDRERFGSWLMGIAAHVASEQAREAGRSGGIDQGERAQSAGVRGPDESLRRAVEGLPEVYREVLWLRYWGGLSCEEIAGTLGSPVGTVTKRLSRAIAMLRESMAGEETAGKEAGDGVRSVS